jgi:hypothetical protein
MKAIIGLLGLTAILFMSGCVVEPAYPHAGVSVGVYGEYPHTYYGHGYYSHGSYYNRPHRWHHPYDRDHYYSRSHVW